MRVRVDLDRREGRTGASGLTRYLSRHLRGKGWSYRVSDGGGGGASGLDWYLSRHLGLGLGLEC